MNRKIVTAGLAVMIVFQLAVLAGEYIGAVYPLWTGREIRLKTVPVDPRSLFRGNYARLNYPISNIERIDDGERTNLRSGEIVYVRLKPDANGLYVFDGASLEKPETGPFIRGRLQDTSRPAVNRVYHIRYGIEAYFAPKKKALALEKDLRGGGVAVVMVAANGKATLKDVIADRN